MKEPNSNLENIRSVLAYGENNLTDIKSEPGKSPIFTESTLTELAESFADILLRRADIEDDYQLAYYYFSIKRFSPASARRLKAKYKNRLADVEDDFKLNDSKSENVKEAIDKAKEGVKDVAEDEMRLSPEEKARRAAEEAKSSLFESLQTADEKKLSDEEKSKFVAEARKIIATMDEPLEKIAALSGLAFKVKQLGDKKLASELMDEANLLVSQQPRNYMEFLQVWLLAGGYATVDAEKAFPLLEDTVFRLNDTIAAFAKVAEFMDMSDEIISDNEVQIGSFGGSLTRDLTRTLKNADVVMENLARADFARTKMLADRFDRTEVRIFAKMLILRSILGGKKTNDASGDMMDKEGF
jgi:hypothetical protein